MGFRKPLRHFQIIYWDEVSVAGMPLGVAVLGERDGPDDLGGRQVRRPAPDVDAGTSTPARLRRLVESPRFQHAILAVIVANAAIVGLETVPQLRRLHGGLLRGLDQLVLAVFSVELVLRIAACWPRPLTFFRNGWNVFDFTVVAASLTPAVGSFASVARLARLLRVMRVVSTVPELRLIVGTMLRSIPSLGHVVLLLGLLLYVYGIIGYEVFGATDPEHWGSLPAAAWTLFQILTLEGWVEIQRRSAGASPLAPVFYASFIVLAVFVVINLFVAVVLNNLERAKKEELGEADHEAVLRRTLAAVESRLAGIERRLSAGDDPAEQAVPP